MKRVLLLVVVLIMVGCDSSSTSSNQPENSSWVFVANEGDFFGNNGYVSMIDEFGNQFDSEVLGDVVQALAVYEDKLIVSVNNSQKLIVFDITESGISNPQEILTDNMSPRELIVIDDKLYFGAWDPDYNVYQTTPGFLKVLNLENFEIESTIDVGIMPEGLLYNSNYLWVANSGESTVNKIDIYTNSIVETLEVGSGPQNLVSSNGDIFISRRFYDENWAEFHGSSKISGDQVTSLTYSSGVICGGSVLSFNNQVYRSFEGGIAPLQEDLNLNESARIGSYNQGNVYHVEIIDDHIWFGLAVLDDSGWLASEPGTVKVIDSNGLEISSYEVGINPGDFAIWNK